MIGNNISLENARFVKSMWDDRPLSFRNKFLVNLRRDPFIIMQRFLGYRIEIILIDVFRRNIRNRLMDEIGETSIKYRFDR